MTQIIPFDIGTNNLPSYMKSKPLGNALSTSGGAGFPSISIKGKVFHIRRGDSNELILNPNDPDAPASSIEVIILNGNPGTAKVWYEGEYTEGSDMKPSCYSNDGTAPAADAVDPQASKCTVCPRNIWGSRISESGVKGRECGDSKRLAVATTNAVEDAMLVRVPAGSLKAFNEYLKLLATRGVENYQAVVTRIGFDYSVAHPALTFKAVGFIDEETYARVSTMVESDVVSQIIGMAAVVSRATPRLEHKVEEEDKPKAAPKAAPKEEPKVEEEDKPKAAPKAATKPVVVVDDIDSGMEAALDSVDWDD